MHTRWYAKTQKKMVGVPSCILYFCGDSEIWLSTGYSLVLHPPPLNKINSGRFALYFIPLGCLTSGRVQNKNMAPTFDKKIVGVPSCNWSGVRRNLRQSMDTRWYSKTKKNGGRSALFFIPFGVSDIRQSTGKQWIQNSEQHWRARDVRRGLQLQRARSTRARYGLLHRVGATCREDSSYRGRSRLAQWTAYRIKKAKPTERTPATEREVDSHSEWSTT